MDCRIISELVKALVVSLHHYVHGRQHASRGRLWTVESSRSWSRNLFPGQPGGQCHVQSGGRLSDELTLLVKWKSK